MRTMDLKLGAAQRKLGSAEQGHIPWMATSHWSIVKVQRARMDPDSDELGYYNFKTFLREREGEREEYKIKYKVNINLESEKSYIYFF